MPVPRGFTPILFFLHAHCTKSRPRHLSCYPRFHSFGFLFECLCSPLLPPVPSPSPPTPFGWVHKIHKLFLLFVFVSVLIFFALVRIGRRFTTPTHAPCLLQFQAVWATPRLGEFPACLDISCKQMMETELLRCISSETAPGWVTGRSEHCKETTTEKRH